MKMPNRSGGDESRYGFNGKETDSEWGSGNGMQDYGFRLYSPAIAKFLSVDPLTSSYPWYTPYQFAGNKPIWAIDLDGLEELIYDESFNVIKKPILDVINSNDYLQGVMRDIQDPAKAATVKVHIKRMSLIHLRENAEAFTLDVTKMVVDAPELEKMPGYEGSELQELVVFSLNLVTAFGFDLENVRTDAKNGIHHHVVVIDDYNVKVDSEEALHDAVFALIHEIVEHLLPRLKGGSGSAVEEHSNAVNMRINEDYFTPEELESWSEGSSPDNDRIPATCARCTYATEVQKAVYEDSRANTEQTKKTTKSD